MSAPLAAGVLLPGCHGPIITSVEAQSLATVIRGGRCFYQGKWQVMDIGIDASGKLRFGPNLRGIQSFPAEGKIVAPGFIDILADNSTEPDTTFQIFEKYKISDGVTTALQMHGGSPDCGWYYRRFGSVPHWINFGVSTFVMGISNRARNVEERKRQVEQNLQDGALGVSHSLEYQPTPYPEVLEYAKLARKYDRPFFLHLRYSSSDKELDGVDEAIRYARESGARVHIDHLHSTGGTFHMTEALDKIRDDSQTVENVQTKDPFADVETQQIVHDTADAVDSPGQSAGGTLVVPADAETPEEALAQMTATSQAAENQRVLDAQAAADAATQVWPATSLTLDAMDAEHAAAVEAAGGQPPENGNSTNNVTPAAQALADEHGIDLSTIEGSGKGGKVMKADVEAAIEKQ